MRHRIFFAATVVCSILAIGQMASADFSPQQKVMAKRAAQMDCYRKLAEIIMGLQIKTGSKVEDFVLTNDKITTYLDTAIKGAKITDSRYFDDGSCEVDMEVTIEQIVDSLKHSFDEVYKGGEWKREEFDEITKHPEYKIIKATGSGAVRPDSQIPDPASEPIVQAPHAHYV